MYLLLGFSSVWRHPSSLPVTFYTDDSQFWRLIVCAIRLAVLDCLSFAFNAQTADLHTHHLRISFTCDRGQGAKFQDVTRQHIVRTVIIMFRIRWWPTFHTSSHKRLASKMGSRELGNVGSKTCQLYWHKDSDESYQHCFTSSQHLARRCARSNLIGVKFN